MATNKGLGKGLAALFGDTQNEYDLALEGNDNPMIKGEALEIDIDKVYPNKNQPRRFFNQEALEELSKSILAHGIINPIVVNKEEDGYMIIAGERRYRAAKKAGLNQVPVIIKDYNEKKIAEIALIENLQREDLNVLEASRGIKELMDKYSLTQEEVSERIGKSRSNVANLLRLLTLSPEVAKMIEENKLSFGHGRTLVVIEDEKFQTLLAVEAYEKALSVRELEKRVGIIQKNNISMKDYLAKAPKKAVQQEDEIVDFGQKLERRLSTKVKILGDRDKGKIVIDYFSYEDLERLYELLETVKNK